MPASGPLGAIPWRTDTVPFSRQPMRDFALPHVKVVVFMVAAQSTKTETLFNVLNWHYRTSPKPAMYVAPTEKLCRTLSRDRLDEMLRSNADLWPLVDKRFSKPGSMERWINGARLGMAWAGSPVELISHPVHTVMVDERGVMDQVSNSSSDPVRDAMARTKNYKGGKVGVFSTPTDEDSCPTFAWWRQGTRQRWCWQCPHDGHWFPPMLRDMRYPDKAEYATIVDEAFVECPTCKHEIHDEHRSAWNDDGTVDWRINQDYVPHIIDAETGDITAAPDVEPVNSVTSYWVTGFCTPFCTIGEVAEQYARAAREGTPADVQSVVNQYAGELFAVKGDRPAWSQVLERTYQALNDDDVQLVTMGVDVGKDYLRYVIRGWGYLGESWLLERENLLGATEYDEVWLALRDGTSGTYCGRSVDFALIDSGFNTAQVYAVCRRWANWSPSKGSDRGRPFWDSLVDESRTGRALRTLKLWNFNSDVWKTWLYGKIRASRDEIGGWWVPEGISEEYCQEVTNEKVIQLSSGRRKWVRTGNLRNHDLDCEILAAIAAHIRNVRKLPQPRKPEDPAPKPPPAANESDRRDDPFARRWI